MNNAAGLPLGAHRCLPEPEPSRLVARPSATSPQPGADRPFSPEPLRAVPARAPALSQGLSRTLTLALTLLASALLLLSLKLPLWQMRLEAPQYRGPEALHIAVHPNALRGDLRELTVLDQYIGVHVPPTLPQFRWLPALLVAGASLGLLAGLAAGPFRSPALVLVSSALALALAFAAIQAMGQIRDIGHKRDQRTVLAGVKDFTPPFLGTSKIAQFTVSSKFGLGAWLIGSALTLQLGAAWLNRRSRFKVPTPPALATSLSSFNDLT